ncbi:TPA: AAA family ATPase [Serratia odorifera]|nr:AAA family ATPase [Serratia odorifera]
MNQDIEASVIGGLLLGGLTPTANDVLATLSPEAFGIKFYQDTYRVIQAQAKTRNLIDPMMVAESMGENRFADVMETCRKCPSAANLKGYAGIVSDYYERRQVLALIDDMKDQITTASVENSGRAMDELVSRLSKVRKPKAEIRPTHISEVLDAYAVQLEDRLKNGNESDTLKTGIDELDRITGGMNPEDLVIVAARPGMGKTEFSLKVAEGVASAKLPGSNQKRGVLIFSMEMSSLQVAERSIAGAGNMSVSVLRNPAKMDDEGWGRVSTSIGRLCNLDVWVVDASKLTVEQIRAVAARHKEEHPTLSLILVDYLGLIEKPKADRNDLAIAHISGSLKAMAKDLRTTVMSLSQLSRDVEKRPNKRPVNADLRDSGSIEQDADSIIMLYREAVYDENSPAAPYAEIIVTKNRFGSLGTVYQSFVNGHFMDCDQDEAKGKSSMQGQSEPRQRKYKKGADV